MLRLYRRWKKRRRETQALIQIVAILQEHDRAVTQAMVELETLYYEVNARNLTPTNPN